MVYEAEDSRLGRRVAVKFLPGEMASDSQLLERFQREARAASALNHPNICTIHAIEQHERQHFIVMELLEGQTLAQRMAGQTFELEKLIAAGDSDCGRAGIGACQGNCAPGHQAGKYFSDRTRAGEDSGFWLGESGQAAAWQRTAPRWRSDDTSAETNALTSPGSAIGTIMYMSPEQARGGLVDARTDLFSLGTVLYQMATGTLAVFGRYVRGDFRCDSESRADAGGHGEFRIAA